MSRAETRSAIYREVIWAARLGLFVNLGLGLAKLAGAAFGHSFAMLSDAINSLGDVFASAVVLFALRLAQKPPDAEHPYGHTRAEAIAGSSVALTVLASALLVGWEAIRRFGTVDPAPEVWTLVLAGFNAAIKEALYHYKIRVGRRTGSIAIIANAWDHRADAFCALTVLLGIAVARWGGPGSQFGDEAAALVVAVAIAITAARLFRESVNELMDVQAEGELVRRIEGTARQVADVLGVETLWVRKSGLEYFADIHVEVDPGLTVAQGHRIGHRVKDRLLEEYPELRDVLVHLEPYPHAEERRGDTD